MLKSRLHAGIHQSIIIEESDENSVFTEEMNNDQSESGSRVN